MGRPRRHAITLVASLLIGVLAACGVAGTEQPVASSTAVQATPTPAGPALNVGVPGFTLTTREGRPFRLADARGKLVVLNFWASWCGPCRDEMPLFEATSRQLGDEVLFVGVNATASDNRADAEEFAARLGVTFPIVFDESGDTAATYGVQGLPATFFIDREGVLRAKALGPVLSDRLREHLDLVRQH
jgi:thiol-disulfide isomerase/thioredoxin